MFDSTKFGNVSLNFPLEKILWIAFFVVLVIFATVSVILMYHWRKYGMRNKHFIFAEILYFVTAAVIIFVGVVSLLLV